MSPRTQGIALAIGLAVIGALGDYNLKQASSAARPLFTTPFILGMTLCAATAFGWVYAMKRLDLSTIGTVYSVATVLLLVGIGVLFGERPSPRQQAGVLLAIVSLILALGDARA